MTSKAGARTSSEQKQPMGSNRSVEPNATIQKKVEPNAHRPSPLLISKVSKSEPVTPRKSPRSTHQSAPKQISSEAIEDQTPSTQQKGSNDPLLAKVTSKPTKTSDPGELNPTSEAPKLELDRMNETTGPLEGTYDQEKKTCSSIKDSSASAKVSDGTSSLAKSSGSTKISDRLDFVESGKSSMCRASTSSDVSDDSTCSSISSSINKPHKANDSRWEAIQAVRARDGGLGLNHFRLLKRLGCGDIGSVYLSELSGTKSYFAMKVMDKGSLATRKKLLRAQTEREILQSLDHPFLPTLYTHFETEKFSCLVMEFCPGGDLHTLRQRQPGKHFTEQAVKYDPGLSLSVLNWNRM